MSNKYRLKKWFIDKRIEYLLNLMEKLTYGFKGDTLASALLANGIHLVGRSFKYHRPRGIMTCGSEEPNALVQINKDKDRTEPNLELLKLKFMKV